MLTGVVAVMVTEVVAIVVTGLSSIVGGRVVTVVIIAAGIATEVVTGVLSLSRVVTPVLK